MPETINQPFYMASEQGQAERGAGCVVRGVKVLARRRGCWR